MAYLKGVDLSGSSDISGSIGIFGQVTGSSFTGSFSGSFTATEISTTDLTVSGTASIGYLETIYETASIIYSSGSTKFGDTLDDTHQLTGSLLVTGSSYTINGEDIIITSALNAATSSLSSSLATGIASDSASLAASIVSNSSSAATDIAALVVDSGSFSTRVTDLETFSSSLDDTFATEAELNAATASLSSSLAVDIAANSESISNIESFPYTGSAIISGSLIVTGSTNISGSVTAYSFNIDDNATGTPAIYSSTNLNLSASNAVVVTDSPFRVASLTNAETGSFTSQDGDIIFNSTRAAYMVYSGSAWRDIIIEGFTASYASQALSSSYAITASYAENVPAGTGFPYTGSAIVSGSLIVTGSIYSDSQIYATASHAISASYTTLAQTANTASYVTTAQTASYVALAQSANTASYVETAQTASYVTTAQTASYIAGANVDGTVTSASYAPNTGVTSIIAGSGININQSTGDVTISTETVIGTIFTSSFSNTTTVSITHNFGSTSVIVTTYDENGNEIVPASIILESANEVTATFAAAQSGTIVVIEAQTGEFASASFSSTGSVTLNHSLGTQDLNVVAYDSNNAQFYPDIDILDSSNIKATFASPSSGTLLAIAREGAVSSSFSNTVDTTITHNLSSSAIIASIYDTSYNKIIPSEVSIVDTSSINLTFAATSSGNIVIIGGPIDISLPPSSSYALTASYAETAQTASYATTAQTASYITGSNVDGTVTSASYAENGGVTSIIAGQGISIDQSAGDITISTGTISGGSIASSSFSDALTTTLTHNFGSTNVIASTYDENGNEIIPASITLDSNNAVTATFASAQSGDLVAIEAQNGEFATASFSSTGSVTLNHSLGTQDLNVVAYDTSNVQFMPDIEVLDSSNVKATFATPTSGKLLAVARNESVSASFSNTVNETITHNLSGSAIFVTVYDTSYNEIIPDNISVVDTSSINLTFASPSSGNVVIAGGAIDTTTISTATTYTQAISGSSSYTVNHNLNSEWPIVQVYNSASRAQFVPQSVVSVNSGTTNITFSTPFNGFVTINS